MKIIKWINLATFLLLNKSSTPKLDAEVMLCYLLKISKKQFFLQEEKILNNLEIYKLNLMLKNRINGKPISYIIFNKEFWSLNFYVCSGILIPRSDTEILVEQSLLKISINENKRILDLGTGSGAIALSIAYERPNCTIIGVDNSILSIKIAKKNSMNLCIKNVIFMHSYWYNSLKTKFHIIVSNPPYLSFFDEYCVETDIFYEPRDALISGFYGTECILYIIKNSHKYMYKNGWLFIEHGYKQSEIVQKYFKKYNFKNIKTIKDYNGLNRITFGRN